LSFDAFVCVFRGNRLEANAITAMLQANGLDAVLSTDDAGGARPDVGFVQGTRVLVRSSDEDDARRLIDDPESVPS
jgi:hypothetical protein